MGVQQLLLGGYAPPFWYAAAGVNIANIFSGAFDGSSVFLAKSYSPDTELLQSLNSGATYEAVETTINASYWEMAYGNGTWVIVGLTGLTQYSTDNGETWTAGSGGSGSLTGVAWSPSLSLFCAVRNTAVTEIYTSPTGATWTQRTPAVAFSNGFSIAWSDALGLFAVGATSSGASTAQIMTSPDGTNWTTQVTPAGPGNYQGIAASPARFFATDGSNFMTSDNGTTWSSYAHGLAAAAQPGCCFANPYFLAGSSNGYFYWSLTGLAGSWSTQFDAAFTNSRGFTGGNGKYFAFQDASPYVWLGHPT